MLLEKLNRFTPRLCRLVARHRARPMSYTEIAVRSGLSRATVIKLSHKASWDGVNITQIDKFTKACGVDLLRIGPQVAFLRRRKMDYLKRAPKHQQRLLMALMIPTQSAGAE